MDDGSAAPFFPMRSPRAVYSSRLLAARFHQYMTGVTGVCKYDAKRDDQRSLLQKNVAQNVASLPQMNNDKL